jgi:hypothetical protein
LADVAVKRIGVRGEGLKDSFENNLNVKGSNKKF